MLKNVVIVLFDDAIELFKLQFRSIDLFLEPCTLNIVLNQVNTKNLKKQIKQITKNSKHHIVYHYRSQIIDDDTIGGYMTQQLCKLLVPIDGEYVVLDDKDLFVKPTTYEQLVVFSSPVMFKDHLTEGFISFYLVCVDRLQRNTESNAPFTPRLIKKQVVNKLVDFFKTEKNLIEWFIQTQINAVKPMVVSEFILYDFFDDTTTINQWLGTCYPSVEEMAINLALPPEAHIAKIHRNTYNNDKNRVIIDKFFKDTIFCRYS